MSAERASGRAEKSTPGFFRESRVRPLSPPFKHLRFFYTLVLVPPRRICYNEIYAAPLRSFPPRRGADQAGADSAQKREFVMKKIIKPFSILLILLLTLFAVSCGEKAGNGTEPETDRTVVTEPAAEDPAGGEEPLSLTPEEAKEAALLCVGKTTVELYEKIGMPESSDYAPSCLGIGGEDGNLYYDTYGFIVYTYRENNVETVRDVD